MTEIELSPEEGALHLRAHALVCELFGVSPAEAAEVYDEQITTVFVSHRTTYDQTRLPLIAALEAARAGEETKADMIVQLDQIVKAKDAEIERLQIELHQEQQISSGLDAHWKVSRERAEAAEAALKEAREAGGGIMWMVNEWRHLSDQADVEITEGSRTAIERARLVFDSADDRALLSKQGK